VDEQLGNLILQSPHRFSSWRKGNPRQPADLSGIELPGADLRGLFLEGVDFTAANLAGADLSGARISTAIFNKARMADSQLCRVLCKGGSFADADLSRADLSGGNFTGSNFWSAVMPGADLSGCDLTVAQMVGADLTRGRLARAKMKGARLERTNFTAADLTRVDFGDANLERANLAEARMGGANLKGAFVNQADFAGSSLDESAPATAHQQALDDVVNEEITYLPPTKKKKGFPYQATITFALLAIIILLLMPFWRPLFTEKNLGINDLYRSWILYYEGNEFMDNSRYELAIRSYQAAIALRPRMPEAHLGLAMAYDADGEGKLAIKEVRLYLKYESRLRKPAKLREIVQRHAGPVDAAIIEGQIRQRMGGK